MRTILSYGASMTALGSRSRFWLLALIALAAAACGGDDPTDAAAPGAGDVPLIVVTTTILGDIVTSIVGDAAEVEVLMPAGSDPHDFEPSARQAARLRDADLVVTTGFGLEVGLIGTLDSARDDGAAVIEVGEFIDPLAFGATTHDHDEDHEAGAHEDEDHGHDDADPHYWHDPIRMSDAVVPLADAIAEAVPALDGEQLRMRAKGLSEELREVDLQIEEILAAVPDERRFMLTNHDTFGYFADRYDFEVVGTIIPGGDTLASPSTADLADLVAEIEEHDLHAVFTESIASSDLTDALASEVGAEVAVVSLYTDALGPPGSGADTYSAMLISNARMVADALS